MARRSASASAKPGPRPSSQVSNSPTVATPSGGVTSSSARPVLVFSPAKYRSFTGDLLPIGGRFCSSIYRLLRHFTEGQEVDHRAGLQAGQVLGQLDETVGGDQRGE